MPIARRTDIRWNVDPRRHPSWAAKSATPPGKDGKPNPDGKTKTGADASSDNTGDDGEDDSSDDADKSDDDANPDDKPITLTQKQLNAKLAQERRETERRSQKKLDDAKKAQEEKALEDNKEHQQLAERYKTERDAMTPKVERLTEIANGIIDRELERWPESARALVPVDGDVVIRFEAFERSQPFALELLEAKKGKSEKDGDKGGEDQGGNSGNPPPKNPSKHVDDDKEAAMGQFRIARQF